MDELLAGRITFKVKNSQGNIVNASVVQYPSDSKYYVNADGSLLWQVQPIQQSSNTIILLPSETITSGFELISAKINVGAFLRVDDTTGYKFLVDENGKIVVYAIMSGNEAGLATLDGVHLEASPKQYYVNAFNNFGFKVYRESDNPTSNFNLTIGGIPYEFTYENSKFTVSPAITSEYEE